MPNNTRDATDAEPTSESACPCDPALIAWDHDNGYATEHQYVIPGTCSRCGDRREYVYNEAGIRSETGEYIHEF